MIDLNDYFYFAQVVDHGGFAAAGRALNQPKSKLSKRVAALEARLGVRLLERTSRRFRVTEIGEAFYERCKTVLSEAEAAEDVAALVQGEPSGMVRLSCPEGIMGRPLAELLPQFLARYPKVKLQVYATDRKVDLVAEKIDLAVRVSTNMEAEAALTIRMLGTARRILVAAPDLLERLGPVEGLEDLHPFPTLTMPNWSGHDTWHFVDPAGAARVFHHEPRLTYVDFGALHKAALMGIGVGLLLESECRANIAAGRLVELLPDWSSREGTIYLVFTSKRGLRPGVRALIDFLVDGYAHSRPPAQE